MSLEAGAGTDVVGAAAEGVLGHLPGDPHLLHPPVEVVQVCLQHGVPLGCPRIEQHRDLVERHPGILVALDRGDPGDVVAHIATSPGAVSRRVEQTHRLPVPQHVGGQSETLSDLADGPGAITT